ncbi:uncharacterized protein LOC134205869 [Armigeres subalbatus]|uniref:uncharacterized protein LOC134205869 n=1 Tax=Armigeres subalbatus TaxID=124917 RepID=UPI002ED4BBE3
MSAPDAQECMQETINYTGEGSSSAPHIQITPEASSSKSKIPCKEQANAEIVSEPIAITVSRKLHFFCPDTLKAILSESLFGKQILKASETLSLSNAGRKFVVDTVAKFHINQGRKTSGEILGDYSDAIIVLFRKESKVRNYGVFISVEVI